MLSISLLKLLGGAKMSLNIKILFYGFLILLVIGVIDTTFMLG
jgi:hypothetical protein